MALVHAVVVRGCSRHHHSQTDCLSVCDEAAVCALMHTKDLRVQVWWFCEAFLEIDETTVFFSLTKIIILENSDFFPFTLIFVMKSVAS